MWLPIWKTRRGDLREMWRYFNTLKVTGTFFTSTRGRYLPGNSAVVLPWAVETTRAPREGERDCCREATFVTGETNWQEMGTPMHASAGRKAEHAGSGRVHSLAAHGASLGQGLEQPQGKARVT